MPSQSMSSASNVSRIMFQIMAQMFLSITCSINTIIHVFISLVIRDIGILYFCSQRKVTCFITIKIKYIVKNFSI